MDDDEVKLTRYVGLSPSVEGGYNSYFYVNGRKATLSTFDSLLAHAKISADGYNIVQQGDVSRIVEMSPVERRRVLEDIAGISRFDEDIRKAEEKRLEVEGNLQRLDIILGEIRRQLRQLEQDRKAALRYKETKEALDKARAQQAHREAQILRQQVASSHEQVEKHQAEKAKLREERSRLHQALEEADRKLSRLEEEVVQKGGEEFKELKEKLDNLRIERARAQDGIERGKDELKELKVEGIKDKKEREKIRREIEGLRSQQEEIGKGIEELERSVTSKDGEIATLEDRASQSDARIVELQKTLVAVDQQIEEVEGELKNHLLEQEKLKQTLEHLEEQISHMDEDIGRQEFEVQDARWQLKDATSKSRAALKELKALRLQHEKMREEEKELSSQSNELEAAIRTLSREYSHLKAEAEAADNVRKGYNRAVTAILEARDTGKLKGVHGTIAELAVVRPEHEVALKVAAGARMQAIVVADDAVASKAIGYLKSKKLGRAIFLPLNKMLPGRPRGKALLAVREALGFALDLVSFKEEYKSAFWYVFGDTVVVKDLALARRLMGGVRLVTLDGQLVEASGAMIGGQVDDNLLRFGQVARGRLDDLGKRLRVASEELKKVEDRLRAVREELEPLESKIKEVQDEEDRRETKADALRKRVKDLEGGLQEARKALASRVARKEEVLERLASLETEVEGIEEKLGTLKADRESMRSRISEVTPQRIARKLRELQGERLSLVERLNDLNSRSRTLESQIELQTEREAELHARLAEIDQKTAQGKEMIVGLSKKLSQVEEELLGLQKLEERLLQEMKDVRDRRDEAFREKTEIDARLEKLASKLETTEDFLLGLEAQLASLQDKLREAEAQVQEHGALADDELPPLEEIRNTITRCERALDSIGAVNLRALEDYEAQQSRHDELREELSRLKKERKNLLRLVEELEGRRKEGLLKVFHAIRENFKDIFAELSEGGDAELLLENEEDPFQGGLVIKARPPNKRFLRLEALSGGEKSLVSMAFIFAIQEYDPSPFYLLDEVDQNLDGVNAERIARMIRKNSSTAQFIQISLRKVSLKEADHIVGVTMSGRSISEVVMKVNLDEVVEETGRAEAAA